MDQLGSVRSMAVREAMVTDPELALDVLLTGLLGQVRGEVYSWQQAVEIKAEKNPFHIDDAIMGHSSMRDIEEIAAADIHRVSEAPALAAVRKVDPETKLSGVAHCDCKKNTRITLI